MDASLLAKLETSNAVSKVEYLKTRILYMAAALLNGKQAEIKSRRVANIDTSLHIRHGTSLTLRNLQWTITDQTVGEPLLGGPVLEALGLNSREMLAAAAHKYSGSVDASLLPTLHTTHGTGRISRVMEGIYHEDGGEDESDAVHDGTPWCELGPETDKELEAAVP